MHYCNIPLNTISDNTIKETLRQLPQYSSEHGLAFGIAHELTEKDWINLPLDKILSNS